MNPIINRIWPKMLAALVGALCISLTPTSAVAATPSPYDVLRQLEEAVQVYTIVADEHLQVASQYSQVVDELKRNRVELKAAATAQVRPRDWVVAQEARMIGRERELRQRLTQLEQRLMDLWPKIKALRGSLIASTVAVRPTMRLVVLRGVKAAMEQAASRSKLILSALKLTAPPLAIGLFFPQGAAAAILSEFAWLMLLPDSGSLTEAEEAEVARRAVEPVDCGADLKQPCESMSTGCAAGDVAVRAVFVSSPAPGRPESAPERAARASTGDMEAYISTVDQAINRCAANFHAQAGPFFNAVPYSPNDAARLCADQATALVSTSQFWFASHAFFFREMSTVARNQSIGYANQGQFELSASAQVASTLFSTEAASISNAASRVEDDYLRKAGCGGPFDTFEEWSDPVWPDVNAPAPAPVSPPSPGRSATPPAATKKANSKKRAKKKGKKKAKKQRMLKRSKARK